MNKWEFVGWVNFFNGDKNSCLRQFSTGKRKLVFNVKLKNGKSYIDCETWDDNIIDNLKHGDFVEITNYRLSKNSWNDKNTGEKKYALTITVQEMCRIINSKNSGSFVDKTNETFDSELSDDIKQEINKLENNWDQELQTQLKQEIENQQKDSIDLDWLNDVEQ